MRYCKCNSNSNVLVCGTQGKVFRKCVYVWVGKLNLSRCEITLLSAASGSVVDLGDHPLCS